MGLLPVIRDLDELAPVSQCWHHFRGSDRALRTVDGKVGVLTRASTNVVEDDINTGFTVGYHIGTFERKSFLVNGVSDFAMSLRLGSADRLVWDQTAPPQAFGFFLEFMHLAPSSGEALLSITNDAASGARFIVDWSGTYWRARFHNGTTDSPATLAAAPTASQTVRLWGWFFDNGTNMWVQLNQSIQGAAATSTAASTAVTRASAWASGAKLRYSALGTSAGASARFRTVKLIPSAPTFTQLLRTF